ncbi:MAG TPA: hypothetical protein VFU15_05495 [Bacteroidia bacterium]|nr:hypothetical protein [Bacteroidia bacterium]
MAEVKRYELAPLEAEYRSLTTGSDRDAASRMRNFFGVLRYDLRMGFEVVMEYREGMDEPMTMRILRSEKDLDRWIEHRFARLQEF